ncbi:MAG: tetratricopeptide repeat protein [Candidatus Cloacimonetes bacterium]|nr:tetratricopeptide repeat protein [Candidatus Cloacimonadota bacterium]
MCQTTSWPNPTSKRLEKEGIISGTIENLLINEYENLDSEAQKMLKIASIIGKAFALDELNVVSQAHINSDYQEIIQSLSNSRIIGKKTFNPGIEYVFNNHLMRDAIYRTILMSEKRNLHEKIGQFYEEKYARNINPYLELIANHYIYAGAEVKALQYAILSGEKTARLAAYPESNYYYEKAISFCRDSLQGYHIRLAMIKNCVNQGDANTAWELISALEQSHSMHLSDDYYLQKVRILTLKGMNHDVVNYVPDILPLIQKSSFKDSIRLRYMDALNALNRLDEFMAEAEAMRIAVADSSDAKLKGDFYTTMALMHLNRSEYTKAAEYYQKLRAQAEHSQDQIHLRIAFSGLGVVASRQGDKAQARHYYELALAICERLGDRNGYSKAILDLGTLLRNEGEIDAAIQMYLKSLSTAEAIGNIVQQSTATYNIGEAYYYQDLFDEALEYMEKALALSDTIGDMLGKTFCYDAMGDIHFRKDELDEAEAIYNANLKLQHELKDNEGIAHSIGNLANIANTRGNFAAAEELYLKQAEILSDVGDLDGKVRAFYNRAMLYLDAGKKDTAIELLHEACMLFEQCKAQIFIDIVKDKLKEVQDSSEQ